MQKIKKYKTITKEALTIVTLIIIFLVGNTPSFALQTKGTDGSSDGTYSSSSDTSTSGDTMAKNILDSGKEFIKQGSSESTIDKKDIQDKLLPIANIIVYIATAVFVVVGSILGLRYMLAQDMQERAQIKNNLIWFVIAMAIVYGGVGIYNIVVKILNNLF